VDKATIHDFPHIIMICFGTLYVYGFRPVQFHFKAEWFRCTVPGGSLLKSGDIDKKVISLKNGLALSAGVCFVKVLAR
jgi:hypothetical protein